MITDKHKILYSYFGYTKFRTGQESVIDNILSKRDTLCIMPTGGGKSICYQIPALIFNGITIVISPLISLMKNQVNALNNIGINTAYLNSSLTEQQYEKVLQNILNNKYKIIYVAPERLSSIDFINICKNLEIAMIAVDEAHCISQWGHSFRPSYRKIPTFIKSLNNRPIISAFTATATEEIKKDIIDLLNLNNPFEIVTGFDRPNLYLSIVKSRNKSKTLLKELKEQKHHSGIIYCSTHRCTENVYEFLHKNKYDVTMYHAGLSGEERKHNQDDFINGTKSIIVSTNAFGMGIDKPDIEFVIHYNMPKSIEGYYQEVGRAGRNGEPAKCVLIYDDKDIDTNIYLINHAKPNPELDKSTQEQVRQKNIIRFEKVIEYCISKQCSRRYILNYFGEQSKDMCNNCSYCHKHSKLINKLKNFLNSKLNCNC